MKAKFPFYKQFDEVDCGPVCLKMICKYYGRYIQIEKLKLKSFLSKEGTSLLNIKLVAENIGLNTVAAKVSFQDLIKTEAFPCVALWKQNHYVVIHKIKKKKTGKKNIKVFVADPAYGLLAYTEEEFLKGWSNESNNKKNFGIVLLLKPTETFYNTSKVNKEPNGLKFLTHYFFLYRKYFFQIILGILLGSVFQLSFPFLTQAIIDKGIQEKNIKLIYLILLAQLILILSQMSVKFIRNWILLHISARINISMVSDFFIKLMKLPMSFFDSKNTGDFIQI